MRGESVVRSGRECILPFILATRALECLAPYNRGGTIRCIDPLAYLGRTAVELRNQDIYSHFVLYRERSAQASTALVENKAEHRLV